MRSVELRFFSPIGELSDAKAGHLTRVDGVDRFALVALEPDGRDEIIAVVRYEREAGGERAEYAAVVEDRRQRRGMGRVMTDRLIETARSHGVLCMYALVSTVNEPMLGLLRVKVFRYAEVTVEKILASCALPMLFSGHTTRRR